MRLKQLAVVRHSGTDIRQQGPQPQKALCRNAVSRPPLLLLHTLPDSHAGVMLDPLMEREQEGRDESGVHGWRGSGAMHRTAINGFQLRCHLRPGVAAHLIETGL